VHSAAQQQAHEERSRVAVPIAAAVRRLRAKRGWTLDELAARSGISRRLIVQIEQAQANPSVGTLLRIADAFEVTFTELLPEQPAAKAGVRARGEALELWAGAHGGSARLLGSRGPFELWSFTLKPGDALESEAHRPGCIELLTVTTGRLHLGVGAETFLLAPGDSAWLEADEAHAYRNRGRSTTHFTLAVLER
jgi:transcriptional regulator with XRE-family HTH domain